MQTYSLAGRPSTGPRQTAATLSTLRLQHPRVHRLAGLAGKSPVRLLLRGTFPEWDHAFEKVLVSFLLLFRAGSPCSPPLRSLPVDAAGKPSTASVTCFRGTSLGPVRVDPSAEPQEDTRTGNASRLIAARGESIRTNGNRHDPLSIVAGDEEDEGMSWLE